MEAAIKEKERPTVKEAKKGKRKWLSSIGNFLMFGGWILVAAVILGILVLISYLSK
jgi:hypothetical protein